MQVLMADFFMADQLTSQVSCAQPYTRHAWSGELAIVRITVRLKMSCFADPTAKTPRVHGVLLHG
jgi:hypothetical protein